MPALMCKLAACQSLQPTPGLPAPTPQQGARNACLPEYPGPMGNTHGGSQHEGALHPGQGEEEVDEGEEPEGDEEGEEEEDEDEEEEDEGEVGRLAS